MIKFLSLFLFLVLPSVAFADAGQVHFAKPQQLEVREEASPDAEVILIVAVGRKLVELERQDGWIMVGIENSGGEAGWIKASQVSATDPDGMTY